MAAPALLYCVGATKAGTTWLYRFLHDHPDCALPAVKEAHYWDTFDADSRSKQVAAFQQRLQEMHRQRAVAGAASRHRQVGNLDRRIADMAALVGVLDGPRDGHSAYANWLLDRARTARLAADITPNYAILPADDIARMRDLSPKTKFIYLIRDPLDRLWSHIRMQARRQRQAHEVYEKKANNILYRILNRSQETHILARGDYPTVIAKLRTVIPRHRLLVQFAEDLCTLGGIGRLCSFLEITVVAAPQQPTAHAGQEVAMRHGLRPKVQHLLHGHYDWVAQHVGPLPQRWQDNRTKV